MNFSWEFFWHYLLQPSDVYLYGLWLTCIIAVSSMLLGCVFGLIAAMIRLSPNPLLQYPVRFYVWLMRGTPLLVQIVFLYTALAAGGVFHFNDLDLGLFVLPGNIQAAILALGLNEGAYMAEIMRAGIGSVDKGQYEAARTLGMTFPKLMRRIVLPQAFRVIVPPLGNEFNVMLKNTTLVSVIGVQELLLSTQMVTSVTFRVFELYLVVALYFLLLTTLWGFFQHWLEKRFNRSEGGPGSASGSASGRMFGQQTLKMLRGR
ncbi:MULTISPECIES: amino acid ABC transporter permease [unclassified Pseudomonas]|uniref:amino acid ABC transporter permease n=1 Tax=unclassified Pseudomonas TaxID=196821 RepID=UPI000BD29259|nr:MULTISPECIES: amino acid ABC transporter permease [unclassified Pseudomonas]PVZ12375.1 polar amino acid transport system permease protein [Pseudomonas sp. URIL14HWK12:I12]PVZ23473.1 polar amino acid transport system permease protein [Pseudomonas sp. URIL14HWK12:I10]PVZ32803.1 polar amino acid transport system permease protein [Pseudomonas sp. URIL14HWK12:I11]SNZ14135.1 amino acid ABC transporter membrane protein, PAAT family (TC 3.A.1.3.-) [Pseudomonas sp. URIL14HWK12:I9]